jgi:hypothetical protein
VVLAALDRCQPYWDEVESGKEENFRHHRLWQLHALNIVDKHRTLLLAVCAPDVGAMWWGMPLGQPSPRVRWATEAREGQPIAWFNFGSDEPPTDFDPHLSLQIALRDAAMPQAWHNDLERVVENLKFWVKEWVFEWRFERILNGEEPYDI